MTIVVSIVMLWNRSDDIELLYLRILYDLAIGPSSSHIKTLVLLCLQNGALSYSEKDRLRS